MEYTTYASRLRYLDADDVDDTAVDYDGLDVIGADGQKLGDVDGFIVDADATRVYYVVVDSGEWFRSRQFLLPIGHATLEADRRALRVDVRRDALEGYPEFDKDRFRQFSDEELRAFESRTATACCPDETRTTGTAWSYDHERHYRQPDWWRGKARTTASAAAPIGVTAAATERLRQEDAASDSSRHPVAAYGRQDHGDHDHAHDVHERDRDLVTARDREGDVSPHFDNRAQPGDVLGIETGGETTSIGDSAEDEDKRRRDAKR